MPARSYTALPEDETQRPEGWDGRLALRDFDQGRGDGQLEAGGPPPPATVILVTAGVPQPTGCGPGRP